MLPGLWGCEGRRDRPLREAQKYIILIGTEEKDPAWQAFRVGAAGVARGMRYVHVKEVLPSSATAAGQKVALERVRVGRRPSAVCVLAIRAEHLIQPIASLTSAGIGVLLVGDDAPKTRRKAFLGPNAVEVGQAMAEVLEKQLTAHRTLMVIHDDRGDERSRLRHEGFIEGVEQHVGLDVLKEHDCLGDPEGAMRYLRRTSERFPNLGGWALIGDWLREDVAFETPLIHGSARIVAYGIHPRGLDLLESGHVNALVGVDWKDLGARAVRTCLQLLSPLALPITDYEAPPLVVTRENVADVRSRLPVLQDQPAPAEAAGTSANLGKD